ncbi:hypothetical protein FHT29_001725 [Rhizobium sp. SG741]|nr:hypothetical protein [Rhizobium sp. SG741]
MRRSPSSIAALHGVAYQRTDTRGNGHRDSTPESNADCGFYYLDASSPSANGAQQRENDKRHTEHGGNEYILRGKLSIRRPLRGCRRSSPAFTTAPPLRPCVTLLRPTEMHGPAHGNKLFRPTGPFRQLTLSSAVLRDSSASRTSTRRTALSSHPGRMMAPSMCHLSPNRPADRMRISPAKCRRDFSAQRHIVWCDQSETDGSDKVDHSRLVSC